MNLGDYIGQKVQQAFTAALNDVFGSEAGDMKTAAQAGADELASNMTPGNGGLLGWLTSLPFIGGLLSDVVDPLKAILGSAGGMIEGLALSYGLGSVVGEVLEPAMASLVYSVHRAAGDARLDAGTVAGLWAKGVMSRQQAQDEANDLGYDPGRVQQLHDGALTYPDAGTLLELYRRGTVQLPDVMLALQRHGYPADWAGQLVTLTRNLLSPADLALGHLRGDIDQATLNTYTGQLGIDGADMDILIANTGEPPGLSEMMAMWRRQIIDQPRFERGVRQSRVRNEWIPFLESAIYQPMSAADAVRATVQHHLDPSQAQTIAQMNGLRPEDFPVLVESYGRPLSHEQMMTLYYRGQATLGEVTQAFAESDMKDKYAAQAVNLGRRLIPERQVTTMLQHGVISHPDAIAYLMMEGYVQQDAEYLVALGAQEHHLALKELTKADIQTLYTDRLITHQQAVDRLATLGYSAEVSGWILSLADARRQASLARTLQTQVKALFQKHELDREQAIGRLVAGGVPQENARAIVDEWELVHSIPSRTLTEAQTIKAAADEIIPVQEAQDRLQGMGYSEHDAVLLLKIAGLIKYTPIPQSTGGGGQGGGGGGGGG